MLFLDTKIENTSDTLFFDLLSEIDQKIYKISKQQLNSIKFGTRNKVNYDLYEDLLMYKSILNDIIYCSTCLCDINHSTVVQRIKKLINTPC